MRTQRNMAQMKEQIKTPEKELYKREISNLSDTEFKTLVVPLAGVAQWIECWPMNQWVTGSIPSLGHMPGLQSWSPVGDM